MKPWNFSQPEETFTDNDINMLIMSVNIDSKKGDSKDNPL